MRLRQNRIRLAGRVNWATTQRQRWLVAAFAAVVLCYLPTVFFEYGWGDDYRLLAFYGRGFDNMELMISQGRPVQALIANVIGPNLTSISSLRWLRLGAITALGCSAALYAYAWTLSGSKPSEASLVSAATFALPAAQITASFSVLGFVTAGILAAGVAALVADGSPTWTRFAIAWLLLALAVGVYPPAAMMFWAFAAVLTFGRLDGVGERALRLGALGLSVLPIGLAFYLLGIARLPPPASQARGFLASDPIAKLDWFVRGALRDSLNLWNIRPLTVLAIAVGIACVAGMVLHVRGSAKKWPTLAAALVLPVLSYLPSLISAEPLPPYRTQMALSAIVLLYVVLGLRAGLASRPHLHSAVLAVTAVGALATAMNNTTTLVAAPKARELALVRSTLESVPLHGPPLRVIQATNAQALAGFTRYGEFGRPSLASWWGAESLTSLVLWELGGTRQVWVVTDSADIDWRQELREERMNAIDARHRILPVGRQ
jgi:hypothetical protein